MTAQIIPESQCAYCQSCSVFVNSLTACHNCANGAHLLAMAPLLNRRPHASEIAAILGTLAEVMNERIFA